MGKFILGIAAALGTRLDGVVDFIDSLSAVADPLNEVSGERINVHCVLVCVQEVDRRFAVRYPIFMDE